MACPGLCEPAGPAAAETVSGWRDAQSDFLITRFGLVRDTPEMIKGENASVLLAFARCFPVPAGEIGPGWGRGAAVITVRARASAVVGSSMGPLPAKIKHCPI